MLLIPVTKLSNYTAPLAKPEKTTKSIPLAVILTKKNTFSKQDYLKATPPLHQFFKQQIKTKPTNNIQKIFNYLYIYIYMKLGCIGDWHGGLGLDVDPMAYSNSNVLVQIILHPIFISSFEAACRTLKGYPSDPQSQGTKRGVQGPLNPRIDSRGGRLQRPKC